MKFVIALGIAALMCAALIAMVYWHLARDYDLSKLGAMPERTVVVDRNGEVLGRLHGQNRIVVPLSDVSPHFTRALLAREDSRFYQHSGVDYVGVLRAMVRNVKEQKVVQGASTITMQLARNSYPGLDEKTLHRKLLEVMLARRIEASMGKDEILQHYVNRIFFGQQIYGIQQAARVYFGKDAAQLTAGEGALLAGIIRGPSKFSPFRNWEGALLQRNDVADRMKSTGMVDAATAEAIRNEELVRRATPMTTFQGDWLMDAVREDLDIILEQEDREDGGLTVHTTFDIRLQKAALQSLNQRAADLEKTKGYPRISKAAFDSTWDPAGETSTPYLQGAVVLLHNATGGILAMVGGRDYAQSKFNRASQSQRQIGSTIKPFIYAAAMTRGLLPGTLIDDNALPGGWSPQNSDGTFLGPQPMAYGLIRSRNTMTVRVGDQAGLPRVSEVLSQAGIAEALPSGRQSFIGNVGASLEAMTSAFSAFSGAGSRKRPFVISRIDDRLGEVMYATPVLEVPVVTPGVAQLTSRLLHHVMDHGTGAVARSQYGFKNPAGGKTGTTNDFKDAWFIGYTAALTCGVWMGCDKPETIMSGGYGSRLSLPVWADVMKQAQQLNFAEEVITPVPERKVKLCRVTGLVATAGCESQNLSYDDDLPEDMLPQSWCPMHSGQPYAGVPEPAPVEQSPGLFERFSRWFR
jgi:penicillin-binding protein 1A